MGEAVIRAASVRRPHRPASADGGAMLAPLFALAVAALAAIPFAYSVLVSLAPADRAFAAGLPVAFRWQNYLAVWQSAPFLRYFLNSVIVAGSATIGTVITAILAAYVFARAEFRGRDLLFGLVMGTMMIPGHVTLIPNYLTMARLGLIDSYGGLILPFLASGFATFLLRQHFRAIPRELDEAARMDGAGSWLILWRVIVPLSRPAIATAALYQFVTEWNAYLWPLIATDSESMRTVQLGLAKLFLASGSDRLVDWPVVLAASVTVLLPTLIAFLVAQRQLIHGNAVAALR
jgi:multiple sugar transport system permease protein/sn-glycerol 3-phosphate transport system permease protein